MSEYRSNRKSSVLRQFEYSPYRSGEEAGRRLSVPRRPGMPGPPMTLRDEVAIERGACGHTAATAPKSRDVDQAGPGMAAGGKIFTMSEGRRTRSSAKGLFGRASIRERD